MLFKNSFVRRGMCRSPVRPVFSHCRAEPLERRILLSAAVVARQIFYNDSVFDGNDPSANAADDQAIAPDKQPLLPGQTAAFANYTSYSKGINGIMVDVQGLTGTPTASDFTFRTGNDDNPAAWSAAPAPSNVLVRPFAGLDSSSRIEMIWADGAITNTWLQVTLDADANTGLATLDVFYFGNKVGETGKPAVNGAFAVTTADLAAVQADPHGFTDPAQILNPHDFNRDGRVDATDQLIARNAAAGTQPALETIVAPSGTSPASHPAPALIGGWQSTALPNQVIADSGQAGNAFYQGQRVVFNLTPGARSYEVRDYWGDLVDSGTISPTALSLPINVTQPGWYKLYLYGPTVSSTFGNVVGGTTFSVFRINANFPTLPSFVADGSYFTPALTRIDPQVNFPTSAWGANPPNPSLTGAYGVRWTGQIEPPTSSLYSFSVANQDGARLWVNGQELINDWLAHTGTVDTATIILQAGVRYNIELDYYHDQYLGDCVLSWSDGQSVSGVIPSTALFATVQSTQAGGLTGTYYAPLPQDPTGANDEITRDATGMGPQRYEADASNPSASIAQIQAQIDYDAQNYTPLDPQRSRGLLIAFGNGTEPYLSGVTQIVQHFQNEVEYWEPQNEPNGAYGNGADFVPVMRDFYNTVKAVNPNLKVLGPGTVTINPLGGGLPWIQQFLAAGGGQYIDGFSFHFYNGMNGDLALGRQTLGGLQNLLDQYGLASIPKWQTEQGYFAAEYGVYDPVHEARWTLLEQMLFEQYGIPREHNVLWYDKSHGYWDFPAWWENQDGSLNPAAPLMRVWSEELFGTNFTSALDFGEDNNLLIGSLFSGPGKSLAAFMSAGGGDTNIDVTLNVSSGATIHVVSAFGVVADLPVVNGQVTLPVPNLPIYVELAAGQSIQVVQPAYGADLALAPGTTVTTTASSTANLAAGELVNGLFENWYYQQNGQDSPWTDDTPAGQSNWVQISLPVSQWVDRVVIYAVAPWQTAGTLMSYSIQYNDNGNWVTLGQASVAPKTFAVYTPATWTTLDTFWNEQSQFITTFLPVYTNQIRINILQSSYGGGATSLVPQAGGQADGNQSLSLEEVEIDGQTPPSTALPALGVAKAPPVDYALLAPAPPSLNPNLPGAYSALLPLAPSDQSGSSTTKIPPLFHFPRRLRSHDH